MITTLVYFAVKALGFGLVAAGAWVGTKFGAEAGAAVAGAGGCVLMQSKPVGAGKEPLDEASKALKK